MIDPTSTAARALVRVVAAASLVAVGCGKKDPKPAPAPGSAAAPIDATAVAEAEPPPPTPPDQAAVDALVDAWLAAQNGGDFAAYEALYAERMEGVKRAGPRTSRFDRAGWMADRKRMFGKPMVVTATDRAVTGSATAPVVEFTQSYQQARFSDTGKKRMVLVKSPAGYRIAREEMLASTLGAPPAITATALTPVVEIDKRWFAVLASAADPAWASGRIDGPFEGTHRYALRAAAAAPMADAWRGKALAVYDRAGKRCDATVGALSLLGGGTPHFGEIQAWEGAADFGGDHVYTRAERARAIYDLSAKYLVGELTVTGGCTPAYAAEPARAIVPFAEVPAEPAVAAAATTAFRALPGYKAVADDWRDSGGDGEWAPNPTVTAYGPAGQRVIVVAASEGAGCGEFHGELTALFQENNGALAVRAVLTPAGVRVDAIVDSDGDGAPEVVGAPNDFETVTAHLVLSLTEARPAAELRLPFTDCGC